MGLGNLVRHALGRDPSRECDVRGGLKFPSKRLERRTDPPVSDQPQMHRASGRAQCHGPHGRREAAVRPEAPDVEQSQGRIGTGVDRIDVDPEGVGRHSN